MNNLIFKKTGGSGSSKGEFIWDLMQKHAKEEEELNQQNLRRFVLQPNSDLKESDPDSKRFKFSYIDIEKLVALNIKKRIRELVRESNNQRGQRLYVPREVDRESSSSSCDQCDSQEDEEDEENGHSTQNEEYDDEMKIEKIKPYLTEFANVVTCNWILRLVESEIKKRLKRYKSQNRRVSFSSDSNPEPTSARFRRFSRPQLGSTVQSGPETIFLVNLLPNRINLFKKCLYLNQTPNLNHAQFDYFAINLTRVENDKKKDLDVVSSGRSFLDEANSTFVKYFRSLNKLVEFRIKEDNYVPQVTSELTIRLTRKADDKQAVIIQTVKQLKTLLKENLPRASNEVKGTDRNKIILVNMEHFRRDSLSSPDRKTKSPPSPLIFMVGNRIELEDHKITILVDESLSDANLVRNFVNCLRQVLPEIEGAEI